MQFPCKDSAISRLFASWIQSVRQVENNLRAITAKGLPKQDITGAAEALKEIFIARYSNSGGIHWESVLSGLGAIAGFGCQMAIREALIKTGKLSEKKAFVVVGTWEGESYFFGDHLNRPLLEAPAGQVSVWSLVAGGAQKAGAKQLFDPGDIAEYNAKTVGTTAFGIPRLPRRHEPEEMPLVALKATWEEAYKILQAYRVELLFLGWVPAMAAQRVIIQNKHRIDPAMAAKIVMESALPMSKVDPKSVMK